MAESSLEAKGSDLLNQLETILAIDNQLDEVGFIHPSQFASLNESSALADDSECVKAGFKYDQRVFWHKNHKLGISTQALLPLYKAAKVAFFAAMELYEKDNAGGDDDVLNHSRALVLLSSDFGTAWNSRKLVVSKTTELVLYMNELYLSGLVLSNAPKSDQAWSHRRWVIKMIARRISNLQDIVEKESRLVEGIAEVQSLLRGSNRSGNEEHYRYKMSYRAWYHRCWLVSYMTPQQMSHELQDYRDWSGLHAADNSCFHYRMKLSVGLLQHSCYGHAATKASICSSSEIRKLWKEELDWNESLIKRYIGREALWLHRRFLAVYYIKQTGLNHDISTFIDNELHLIISCTRILDDFFEDAKAQVMHAATYALWLRKQVADPHGFVLRKLDLRVLLNAASPEKILLWNPLLGQDDSQA